MAAGSIRARARPRRATRRRARRWRRGQIDGISTTEGPVEIGARGTRPNEGGRARRRARAAARPPRAPHPTSRNTTATAGGSPATGDCDATSRSRRRREAAALWRRFVRLGGAGSRRYPSREESTLGGHRRRPVGAGTGVPGRCRACWTDPRSIPGRAGSASTTGTRREIEPKKVKRRKTPALAEAGGTIYTTTTRRTRRTECRATDAAAGWTRRWTRARGSSRRPERTTTGIRRFGLGSAVPPPPDPGCERRPPRGDRSLRAPRWTGAPSAVPIPSLRRAEIEAAASARAGSSAVGTVPRLRARRRLRLARNHRRLMTVTITVTSAPRSSSRRCDARYPPRFRPPPRLRASTSIVTLARTRVRTRFMRSRWEISRRAGRGRRPRLPRRRDPSRVTAGTGGGRISRDRCRGRRGVGTG